MWSACPTPVTIPPYCTKMTSCTSSHIQMVQLTPANRGPRKAFNATIVDSPLLIACIPNYSCTHTLTRQLRMTTHKATKPACAPSVVVMINSPEPTIDADRIIDGPRQDSLPIKDFGGDRIPRSLV